MWQSDRLLTYDNERTSQRGISCLSQRVQGSIQKKSDLLEVALLQGLNPATLVIFVPFEVVKSH